MKDDEEKITMTMRMPFEMLNELNEYARKEKRTTSSVVQLALEEFLENNEPELTEEIIREKLRESCLDLMAKKRQFKDMSHEFGLHRTVELLEEVWGEKLNFIIADEAELHQKGGRS